MEKKNLRSLLIGVSAAAGILVVGQSAQCLFGGPTYCCEKDGSSVKAGLLAAKFKAGKLTLEELTDAVCGAEGLVGTCEKVSGSSCSSKVLTDPTHKHSNNSVNTAITKFASTESLDVLCAPAAVEAEPAETPAEEAAVEAAEQ